MKIHIRHSGLKLSKTQRATVQDRLDFLFARFGQRIGLVTVQLSDAHGLPGYKRCQLDVNIDATVVTAEHSDINLFFAVEHAATRAARSVGRAIEKRFWSLNR